MANEVWVCSMNEAVLYLQEAECSTLSTEKTDNGYAITLSCPLDKEIYTYPLTVELDGKLYDIKPNETIYI